MPTQTHRRQSSNNRQSRRENELENPAVKARNIVDDSVAYLREYAREKPETTALWCLGIGFVLGWKLKPW
jgi:hypothetical protein